MILYSYLVFCILFLVMATIVSAYHYRILKNEVTKCGRQEAKLLSSQFDSTLVSVQHALDTVSTSSTLNSLADYTDEELGRRSAEINQLADELFPYIQYKICSDMLVWYDTHQSFLGARNHRYNRALLPGYLRSIGLTEQEFAEILDYKGIYNFHIMPDGTIWMMRSALDNRYARHAVVIGVIDFRSGFFNDLASDSENLYLLFHGDELLYSSRKVDADTIRLLADPSNSDPVKIDKVSYLPVSNDLSVGGISLRICLPTLSIYSTLRLFFYVTAAELFGAVLMTVLFSFMQTRYLYAPVEQVMDLLKSRESEEFEETYSNLIEGLSVLKKDYSELVESKRMEGIKNDFSVVERCLTGEIDLSLSSSETVGSGNYQRFLSKWIGIAPDDCWVMTLIHVPEKWAEIFGKSDPLEDPVADMEGFILRNVVDELLKTDYSFNLAPVGGNFVLLTSMTKDSSSYADLSERLEKLRIFYQQAFEIDLAILVSMAHRDLAELPGVYHQLEEELRYSLFWEIDDIHDRILPVSSSEGSDVSISPSFSLENNRRLLNCLEIGDYENAYQILDQILQSLPRERRYLNFSIYRMYGLISTLNMVLDSRSSDDESQFWNDLNYENKLYNVKTLRQLLSLSRELFDTIITYNAGKNPDNEPGWLRQVLKYIQENYCDINLSVSSIADHFRLSVPHLSRTFKTYMDCGLLEYIQKLRVEKARVQRFGSCGKSRILRSEGSAPRIQAI